MTFPLQASDPLPGVRVQAVAHWSVQVHLQGGAASAPLLPLGDDAGIVWVPKNGCRSARLAAVAALF